MRGLWSSETPGRRSMGREYLSWVEMLVALMDCSCAALRSLARVAESPAVFGAGSFAHAVARSNSATHTLR